MKRSPYQVLGVKPDASFETIREAYRRRIRQLHPDRHIGGNTLLLEEATQATAELTEAWALL